MSFFLLYHKSKMKQIIIKQLLYLFYKTIS